MNPCMREKDGARAPASEALNYSGRQIPPMSSLVITHAPVAAGLPAELTRATAPIGHETVPLSAPEQVDADALTAATVAALLPTEEPTEGAPETDAGATPEPATQESGTPLSAAQESGTQESAARESATRESATPEPEPPRVTAAKAGAGDRQESAR